MIIDFSNPWVFLLWYIVTVGLLYAAYRLKKSKICLGPIVYFILILLIHSRRPDWFMDIAIHRFFNFLGLAASLSMFVVMDEVETRRKVISQVFKNRYKKDKMPSEDAKSFDELAEKEADDEDDNEKGDE